MGSPSAIPARGILLHRPIMLLPCSQTPQLLIILTQWSTIQPPWLLLCSLASFLVLEYGKDIPVSGPLHFLTFCMCSWLTSSLHSGLYSNVISPGRPPLPILTKTVITVFLPCLIFLLSPSRYLILHLYLGVFWVCLSPPFRSQFHQGKDCIVHHSIPST